MRTWNKVIFYRPDKSTNYQHIDALFSETIDWSLIETHWQDMMQVVLSIQAGKVLPSMLLRKLGSHNRQNKLYRAFRELGRVKRTLFLLRYVSESDFRQSIRAETTKVESYNDFLDWIGFGGPVIKSGDPIEQIKQVKYMDLVANTVMLHNVADLTDLLSGMADDGLPVTKKLVSRLSPYMREHIRRFGQYVLNMDDQPPPLATNVSLISIPSVFNSFNTRVMALTLCRMIRLATKWLYLMIFCCSWRIFSAMMPFPPNIDHCANSLNSSLLLVADCTVLRISTS